LKLGSIPRGSTIYNGGNKMKKLKQLIADHAIAYDEASKAICTGQPNEVIGLLWDKEHLLSEALEKRADEIGVHLVGYVNPDIEPIVLL
jgi:hypothetical protein